MVKLKKKELFDLMLMHTYSISKNYYYYLKFKEKTINKSY